MAVYCPSCGKSIPDDSRVCAYCGKLIPEHELQTAPEPEQKKDKIVLIIAIVIILAFVITIAVAATVYVYMSGMIGPDTNTSPSIVLIANTVTRNVTVMYVSSSTVLWSDIEISGTYEETSGLTYVSVGDTITGCYGRITITYEPSNKLLYSYDFTE